MSVSSSRSRFLCRLNLSRGSLSLSLHVRTGSEINHEVSLRIHHGSVHFEIEVELRKIRRETLSKAGIKDVAFDGTMLYSFEDFGMVSINTYDVRLLHCILLFNSRIKPCRLHILWPTNRSPFEWNEPPQRHPNHRNSFIWPIWSFESKISSSIHPPLTLKPFLKIGRAHVWTPVT